MSSTSAPDPAALPPPAAAAFRPWSLAARLTVWYVGSAFALVLCATGFLYWVLYTNLDREDDQFLADKVHILRALLRERPDDIKSIKRGWAESWIAVAKLIVEKFIICDALYVPSLWNMCSHMTSRGRFPASSSS